MLLCLGAQLPLNNNSSAELSLRTKAAIGYCGYIFPLFFFGSEIKVPGLFSAILFLPFFLQCQNKQDDVIGMSFQCGNENTERFSFFFFFSKQLLETATITSCVSADHHCCWSQDRWNPPVSMPVLICLETPSSHKPLLGMWTDNDTFLSHILQHSLIIAAKYFF